MKFGNKHVWGIMLILGCLAAAACSNDNSQDLLSQVEALEAAESATLFAQAKQAADDGNVEKAEALIKQALGRGAGTAGLDEAKAAIKAAQARDRKRRARRSASRSSRSSSSRSSTGGQCRDFVSFTFDGPGMEHSARVSMSGPSGTYVSGNSGNLVSFSGGCVAGNYSFRYTNDATIVGTGTDMRTYSGSFSIDGRGQYCNVGISDGFGVSVNVYCS